MYFWVKNPNIIALFYKNIEAYYEQNQSQLTQEQKMVFIALSVKHSNKASSTMIKDIKMLVE